MSIDPKLPKRSHSKQQRKVGTCPLPSRPHCETSAPNMDRQSSFEANVVMQLTQESPDDHEAAASSLLALSSPPCRPYGSSMDTPFHYIVDSIVSRTSVEASAPSAMIIDETVISNLYSLGAHSSCYWQRPEPIVWLSGLSSY